MVKKTAAELTKDNPELSKRARSNDIEQTEVLSVAQRLMGRAHSSTFTVSIDDGIEVEVYVPTDSEVVELVKLQTDVYRVGKELQKSGTDLEAVGDGIDIVSDGYARLSILMGKLCVDPSLNAEFFASGCISAADKAQIIGGIIESVNKGRQLSKKFR